jgi:ankyrin repeat protein
MTTPTRDDDDAAAAAAAAAAADAVCAAFSHACAHGHVDVVRAALRGPLPARTRYAMLCASSNGHVDVVTALLADARFDPTVGSLDPMSDDHLPIRFAARNGHADVVAALLADARTDASAWNNEAMKTAVEHGHTDVVRVLLTRVDPSAMGNHAIRRASACGHADLVALLLADARTDPGPTTRGDSALRVAARHGHARTVRVLLRDARVRPGADCNQTLMTACTHGHVDVVDALLHDARVRLMLHDAGHRALVVACVNNRVSVIARLLRDARIDPCERADAALSACSDVAHVDAALLLLRDPRVRLTRSVLDALSPWMCEHRDVASLLAGKRYVVVGARTNRTRVIEHRRALVHALDAVVERRLVCRDVAHAYVCAFVTGVAYRRVVAAHRAATTCARCHHV